MAMHGIAPREDRRAFGVGLMAMAVTLFVCTDTSAKWLVQIGQPVLQVVFARYAVHFIIALIAFVPAQGVGVLRSRSPKRQILRSVALFGSTVMNFIALQYLPITVTTTIMFSVPIVVTLLAIPLLGEQVGIRRLVAVCVGFLGVVVVMQPWGAEFHPAMFLSLLAVISVAVYFIMTRMLAGIESNATSQLWSSGLSSMCLAGFVLPGWVWPETMTGYVVLILIGSFAAVGHIMAVTAHRLADASLLAPVVYVQILMAAIAGILVFDTYPTIWTLLGGLIIMGSGIYIWQRERIKSRVRVTQGVPPPS